MRNVKEYTALIAILCLSQLTFAHAQQDPAKQAYIAGDHATAHREWLTQANAGNAEAQFNLGFLYENGQGVGLDLFSALKWYELAAGQNYPAAKGMAKSVTLKIRKAEKENLIRWLPKAEAGDPQSQLAVSEVLAGGQAVTKDDIEAMKWLILALENTDNGTFRKRMLRFEKTLRQRLTENDMAEVNKRITTWKELRKPVQ